MHTLQVTLHLSGQVRFVTFYSGAQPAHVSLAHIVHMHMQMCTYFFGAQCAQLHTLLVIFRFTFIAAGENKISKSGGKCALRYRKWMQFACGAPCGQTELRKPVLCGVLNRVRKSLSRSELLALNDTWTFDTNATRVKNMNPVLGHRDTVT